MDELIEGWKEMVLYVDDQKMSTINEQHSLSC